MEDKIVEGMEETSCSLRLFFKMVQRAKVDVGLLWIPEVSKEHEALMAAFEKVEEACRREYAKTVVREKGK